MFFRLWLQCWHPPLDVFLVTHRHNFDPRNDLKTQVNLKPDASGHVKEQTVMFRDSPEALLLKNCLFVFFRAARVSDSQRKR